MKKVELSISEKCDLQGLLIGAIRKHKQFLEKNGDYPDGPHSPSGIPRESQTKIIKDYERILSKFQNSDVNTVIKFVLDWELSE